MLLRLAYLGITNAFTLLRLLPGSDRDKNIEILSLRHQLAVLQRQLDGQQSRATVVRSYASGLSRRTIRGQAEPSAPNASRARSAASCGLPVSTCPKRTSDVHLARTSSSNA